AGVEWIIWRPRVGVGVSSSKLNILFCSLAWRLMAPLFIVVCDVPLLLRCCPALLLLDQRRGHLGAGGGGFPVQRLEVLGVGRAAGRAGDDVVQLPAERRMAIAEIGIAHEVAQ